MPKKQQIEVERRELTVSNLDKVFFPESGYTKGQIIKFYSDIAEAIIPHLRDRPLTLKRYPDGITGAHFYEKNAPKHTPPWVKRFAVPRSEGGPDINYVLCNDRATLLWVTNLGDVEKHVLLARTPDVNCPTSIVFDLDPASQRGFSSAARIALHLKKVFERLGLETFRESFRLERASSRGAVEHAGVLRSDAAFRQSDRGTRDATVTGSRRVGNGEDACGEGRC
jgi:bifunctional non-homologous end joining protein LigD